MLFFSACYCCEAPRPPDAIYAQKNGVQWTATPMGRLGAGDTLKISGTGINNGSNLHDTLGFNFKYAGLVNYSITPGLAFYHTRVGNGLPLLYYKVDTLFNNYLTITGYNQSTNLVTGNFQIKFDSPADTSTITFLYGNFKAPLN